MFAVDSADDDITRVHESTLTAKRSTVMTREGRTPKPAGHAPHVWETN